MRLHILSVSWIQQRGCSDRYGISRRARYTFRTNDKLEWWGVASTYYFPIYKMVVGV
jgi:hypothetical protein